MTENQEKIYNRIKEYQQATPTSHQIIMLMVSKTTRPDARKAAQEFNHEMKREGIDRRCSVAK